MKSERFHELYKANPELEPMCKKDSILAYGSIYSGTNFVETLEFRGGITVAAPWGGDQVLNQPCVCGSHVSRFSA